MKRGMVHKVFRMIVPIAIIGFGLFIIIGKIQVDKEEESSKEIRSVKKENMEMGTLKKERTQRPILKKEYIRDKSTSGREIAAPAKTIIQQKQTSVPQSDQDFEETFNRIIKIESKRFRDYPGFFEVEILEKRILLITLISDRPSLSPEKLKQSQINAQTVFKKLICRHKAFKHLAKMQLDEDNAVYVEVAQKGSLGHQMWEIYITPEDCL